MILTWEPNKKLLLKMTLKRTVKEILANIGRVS